jgi:MarR family transcriptional regulator, organic hydroperoxide resistance regulator
MRTIRTDTGSTLGTTSRPARTRASRASAAVADEQMIDAIVADLHQMIGSLRCAGTGRMVKAGISMTHLHILWVLEHHGDLTMSRLADLLDVSLSNATGLIDRMEERGLVERVRVPTDRRIVLVRASAKGARIRDEIEALKQDRMRSVLGRIEPGRLGRLLDAVGDLRTAVVEEIGDDHLAEHGHH